MYENTFRQVLDLQGVVINDYPNPATLQCKSTPFRTFLHYTDPNASKELTVFGKRKKGLFYNYDDRLYGEKWREGLALAAKQAPEDSASFYEIALNHFHDTNDVDLQHVILGCNRSNGFSYLIFGYTYTPCPAKENPNAPM
jgi:hypothetical protein